jgi:hypothetical protein
VNENIKQDHKLIEKAVSLSIVEVGIGSIVHGFKLPLGGHILSLNQGIFLTRAITKNRQRMLAARESYEISMIVALLKSLSPAGRKFGPMISIGMQGVLYSLGILMGGPNLLGYALGISALSIWAFLQPFISYYIIYGNDLVSAFQYLIDKLNKIYPVTESTFINIILIMILIKIIIAIILVLLTQYIPEKYWLLYDQKLINLNSKTKINRSKTSSAVKGAFKDTLNPFFIFSFLLMSLFFFVSKESNIEFLWKLLRVFAIAFIIFYLSRAQWFFSLVMKITKKNKSAERLFSLCEKAYKRLVDNH